MYFCDFRINNFTLLRFLAFLILQMLDDSVTNGFLVYFSNFS